MATGKIQNIVNAIISNEKRGAVTVRHHEDRKLPYELITENDAIMSTYLLSEIELQKVGAAYLLQKFRSWL